MNSLTRKNYWMVIWPAAAITLLDQATKWMILKNLPLHASVPVIPGLFNLVHARNRGMAFGMLNRLNPELGFIVLVGASLIAIFLLLFWFNHLRQNSRWISLGLALILGGAVGNLVDRLRYKEVIDFLDFYAGSYHWPAFNVADSSITLGTFLVALSLLFLGRRPGKTLHQ